MLKLTVLPEKYSIIKMSADAAFPEWVFKSNFYSVTRTNEELSVVCDMTSIPENISDMIEADWRMIKVLGPLDFSLTGILSKISSSLSSGGISLFAISTFDTDYILVKAVALEDAILTLSKVEGIEWVKF